MYIKHESWSHEVSWNGKENQAAGTNVFRERGSEDGHGRGGIAWWQKLQEEVFAWKWKSSVYEQLQSQWEMVIAALAPRQDGRAGDKVSSQHSGSTWHPWPGWGMPQQRTLTEHQTLPECVDCLSVHQSVGLYHFSWYQVVSKVIFSI